MNQIDVQFRKFKGEIIAVFPYIIESEISVLSYAHIGQHSGCVWYINNISKAAKESEYLPLLNELKSIGYDNLNIISKRRQNKYLAAFNNKYQ